MSDAAVVTAELELRRLASGASGASQAFVLVHLRYTTADPWAVRLVFRSQGSDAAEWVFARDLLQDGCTAPVGDGTVQVAPAAGRAVRLTLRFPAGCAVFEVDRDELAEALASTYLLVPAGAEIELVDLDRELAMLLASEH